jgi:AraC-like DNA-binding protein
VPIAQHVLCGGLATWQINRVRAYIEENLETPLKTSDLAATTRLSVGHFSRAFRISFGRPPHAHVMIRRTEKAKHLMLLDDPIPLAEIALRCGLSDQAHLSRLFRKIVGDSPATWAEDTGRQGFLPGSGHPLSCREVRSRARSIQASDYRGFGFGNLFSFTTQRRRHANLAVTSKTDAFPADQVNCFDEINLFVAAPQLQQTSGRDTQQLGWLFAAFFWSHAVMQIPTGLILDRSGVSPIGRIGAILWS